ncbi:hypothetical protein [Ruania zhangjianzhongii]|nr:hypothetical protein [Ruania zhangjianzhongii]
MTDAPLPEFRCHWGCDVVERHLDLVSRWCKVSAAYENLAIT